MNANVVWLDEDVGVGRAPGEGKRWWWKLYLQRAAGDKVSTFGPFYGTCAELIVFWKQSAQKLGIKIDAYNNVIGPLWTSIYEASLRKEGPYSFGMYCRYEGLRVHKSGQAQQAPLKPFTQSFEQVLRPQQVAGHVEWLDDGRVGFGYSEGTPVWQPGLSEEEKKSYFPWGEYSDATKNLQLAINAFLATKGCGGINADGKLGPGTCAAAKLAVSLGGPEGVVGPPPTCKQFGATPSCGPPPSPVIEPECTPTKLCPPGQKCEGGKCVPATTPGGGGGGSGSGGGGGGVGIVGMLLLAGAALGAIYLAVSGTGAKQQAA